ncbi:MAG: efflux RND transporter permease subunit, partial [Polyangiaceae bacterium]|nr:efflux RND transporter permease subunit [Polyangiaceae bacterium]
VVVPVSLLTAFVGLSFMGLPANLISLGAIDFGILVDGAIIMVEATLHLMAHNKGPKALPHNDLLKRAAGIVAKPVGFAMLIIIVALIPIFTLERVEGRIFAPMAYTYAFALLGALASAVFVVPALEAILLRGRVKTEEPRWLNRLGNAYAHLIARLLPRRMLVVGLLVALTAGLGYYCKDIGSEFLPELNEGGFYVTAIFPSTISLNETCSRVTGMRERILKSPEVRDVMSHVGRPEDATQAEGPNNAEFFIVLAPEKQWRKGLTRDDLEAELRKRLNEIPGVQYNFSQPITDRVFETISGIIGQVVVKVRGNDLDNMSDVAESVRQKLSSVDGVSDLSIYQAGTVPSLRINLDREALARRGLAVEDVQQTIRIALGGEVATEVWQEDQRFAVALRLPDSVRQNPESLSRLMVGDPQAQVTLGEVARIETKEGRSAIWREDFSRFVAVKFNVRGRDLGSTIDAARASVADINLPEGLYLSWGGEFQNQKRAMERLSITLPLSLLAIVGILYMNFRRWRPTIIIVLFLPIAVLGAVTGLRLFGENFSVSGAVGCIALLGQVVLAGVTIWARIHANEEEGVPNPVLTGARDAFRPVLLTSSLALLGLVPAATSHAMGSETQRPFAIAIVTGLFFVAPAILLVMPLLYKPQNTVDSKIPVSKPAPAAALATALTRIGCLLPALAIIAFQTPAFAQSDGSFTLEQARALLQKEHPRLATARALEQAAESTIKAEGTWTNPEIGIDYVQGISQSPYARFGAASVSVGQFLELRNVPGARRDAARFERDAVRAEREAVAQELYLALEEAFVALAAQHEIVKIREAWVQHLLAAETVVKARVAAGTMSGFDARRIVVARAESSFELENARAEYARLRGELDVAVGPNATSLVGHPTMSITELPTLPPYARVLKEALAKRHDLLAAQARQKGAQAEVEVAKRSVFPGVTLQVMAGYGQAPRQWDVGGAVVLPLPILDRGQGTVPAAEGRAQAARSQIEAMVLAAQQRIDAQYQATQQRINAVTRYTQETDGADDNLLAEATAQFREGRLSVLELVDGIETAQRVTAMRIELARDAHLSEIMLRRLLLVGDPP